MLTDIIAGVAVLIVGLILGAVIQWGRSGTATALQSRDINDINKDLGALKQTLELHMVNFDKFAKSFRPRVENIEKYLQLKGKAEETGKFPAFTGVRPSGEQESVR